MTGSSLLKGRQKQAVLQDKLAVLQEQIDELQRKERERVGRICEKAGVLELEMSPAELEVAMRDLVARFRRDQQSAAVAAGDQHPALQVPEAPAQDQDRDGS
jgi:TraC-like protein